MTCSRRSACTTSVSAFSARAREGATISLPVGWRQLTATLQPESFTVLTAAKKAAADPWRDYWTCQQQISAAAFSAITKLRKSA